ncbi:MAG: hypothetical protein C4K49_08395 [Candidatus Thorarchaeota archaeon]|nr:MAG: hypothetical protein C4K49_08395 [Candidatus Thorarchaeota archaeon]
MRPRGNPFKGTICAIMMVVVTTYSAWVFFSPINTYFGQRPGVLPSLPVILVDTFVYAPIMYLLVRRWLRTMMRRKGGLAAGIDFVETGDAKPEPGDQWGRATRPYSPVTPSRITGSKSDLRSTPEGLGIDFFSTTPDFTAGEELFDPSELSSRVTKRASVASGGRLRMRVSSRAMGSMKASESAQRGRLLRSRIPRGEWFSLHVPSTLVAALLRRGKTGARQGPLIQREDLREKVFSGRAPLTIILVIDVSLSMKGSMVEVRKIVNRIEQETRGSRDRAGIVAFKDSGAVEVQAPTSNWNRIYRALVALRISGLTPLAQALMKALDAIKRERMRNSSIEPLVVLISDFAPNIPLARSLDGNATVYSPVEDMIRAARLLRRERVRLVAVNVDTQESAWSRFLKRPYHEAVELAAMLRARKEGLADPVEAVLAVPEFRKSFGAYLVARIGGGKAFLSSELTAKKSVLGTFLNATSSQTRHRPEDLRKAESYIAH